MLDAATVFFRVKNAARGTAAALRCANRAQAEIIFLLATNDVRGTFTIPAETAASETALNDLRARFDFIQTRSEQLAKSRTNAPN